MNKKDKATLNEGVSTTLRRFVWLGIMGIVYWVFPNKFTSAIALVTAFLFLISLVGTTIVAWAIHKIKNQQVEDEKKFRGTK